MDDQPFADLPAALVDDILAQSAERGTKMVGAFNGFIANRVRLRDQLLKAGLIVRESSLPRPEPLPTICATDGAYAVERLLAADLVVAVGAAVEGLTPPSETRYWQSPYHRSFVEIEPHSAETGTLLRTIMVGMELELATEAPHDVVLLDGSLTLPAIFFNQAFSKLNEFVEDRTAAQPTFTHLCAKHLYEYGHRYVDAYKRVLTNARSDKCFIALPKYSSRREVCAKLQWPSTFDDRALLTLLLEGGEVIEPLPLDLPEEPWHISTKNLMYQEEAAATVKEIIEQLGRLHTLYYKPRPEFPAIRLETTAATALNKYLVGKIVYAVNYQCQTGAIMEPFPNYLADKTVKTLARAMPAFRQIATQAIASEYDGDLGEVYFAMHGYRSESGRK